jgi:DNA-binding NtrC family response regulator
MGARSCTGIVLGVSGRRFLYLYLNPEEREALVRNQLEALVAQMYQSGILYSEAVREFRKRFILTVLEQNNGNQCKAARQLGMHRNTLSRTITELELDVRAVRAGLRRPPKSEKAPPLMEKKVAR